MCRARQVLTEDDWLLVKFWERVRDEYRNQGDSTDKTVILTPSVAGYAAALRVYGYPRALWPWLMTGGMMLHRLIQKQDSVNWLKETGKHRYQIGLEDLTDGD